MQSSVRPLPERRRRPNAVPRPDLPGREGAIPAFDGGCRDPSREGATDGLSRRAFRRGPVQSAVEASAGGVASSAGAGASPAGASAAGSARIPSFHSPALS